MRLPFNEKKQASVLWHLITDRGFFQHAKNRIEPGWFSDPRHGRVYYLLKKFYEAHGRLPVCRGDSDCAEFKESAQMLMEQAIDRKALCAAIDGAAVSAKSYGLDVIKEDLTEWLKTAIFRRAMAEAERLYAQEDFGACYDLVYRRMKEVQNARFENSRRSTFSDLAMLFDEAAEEYADACTFGLPEVDKALSSGQSTTGCLVKGDTTVLIAPSNTGKTTALITIALANVVAGKHVLWVAHEGRPDELKRMAVRSLLRATRADAGGKLRDQAFLASLAEAEMLLDERLWFVPVNGAGITVEEVGAIVRDQQDTHTAQFGRGFDLLVDDYPAKLTNEVAQAGGTERRHQDETTYQYFCALADELRVHALVAAQTNRHASKASREGERGLENEDVAEAWGIVTTATNVITMARSAKDKRENWVTYRVTKTRSAAPGLQIRARSDFDRATSHRQDLDYGVWYADESLGDVLDRLIEGHPGAFFAPDEVAQARAAKEAADAEAAETKKAKSREKKAKAGLDGAATGGWVKRTYQ